MDRPAHRALSVSEDELTSLNAWLPAIAWSVFIFILSTHYFSAVNTGAFIEPILRWFLPSVEIETIHYLHMLIRKSAHFTEYLVLFTLLVRGPMRTRPQYAIALCLTMAMLDEGHQAFVASRTASIFDVGLDLSGALFGGFVRAAILELV